MNNTPTPTPTPRTEKVWKKGGGLHSMDFHARTLERELTAVTEQRNELENKLEKSKSYKNVMKRDNARLRKQLTAVTEQRDRLAEALEEMRYAHTDKAERMANEAFQSLTTNEQ
jgi:chromosome segregation ATPase